jgi:hypothetical protein
MIDPKLANWYYILRNGEYIKCRCTSIMYHNDTVTLHGLREVYTATFDELKTAAQIKKLKHQ